jgi:osmotically-inducible protein OsmY
MRRSSRILGATIAVLLVACAGAQQRGHRRTDRALTRHVEMRLAADPDASMIDVDVDTLESIVTLRGEVGNETERTAAEDVARYTEGVRGVRNLLVVKDRGLAEASDEGFSDAWIRSKVGARLMSDPDVRRFRVDVDVDDGVVTLSGTVASAEAKQAAEEVAERTSGVRRVVNEIEISASAPAPVLEE